MLKNCVINDIRLAKSDRFATLIVMYQANRRAARRFASLNIITRIADKSICSGIMPSKRHQQQRLGCSLTDILHHRRR